MQRLLGVILLCVLLLTACGVSQTPPEISSSGQGAEQAPYPTPIGLPSPILASPTISPSVAPPTVMPPTVASTATPAPIPMAKLVKTLTLDPLTGPNYLVGWSPDASFILYTQIGDEEDMSEVYTINMDTGEQKLIDGKILGGKQGSLGYYTDFGAPQWIDTCCSLILAKPKPNNKQELIEVDNQGFIKQSLGIHNRGSFFRNKNKNLVIASDLGISQSLGKRSKIDIPDFSNRDVLASFKSSAKNKGLYNPDSKSIKLVDLDNTSLDKSISISDLTGTMIAKKNISLSSLRIQGATWSPDGSKLAFWLSSSTFHELWIADSDGSGLRNVYLLEQSRGGVISWSPDNTMIAFTNTDTGNSPITTLNIFDISSNTSILIDSGVYYNPVWDYSSHFLASTLSSNDAIAVYNITK
jgi:hypothetical protein